MRKNMNCGIDCDGNPVSQPFKSLKSLSEWFPPEYKVCASGNPLDQNNDYQKFRHSRKLSNEPKTLVCHDMAGGYLDDRFIQGCCGETNGYLFYHWQLIDTFIYFSHHFITIPPSGWIRAAHKHGVDILGTIITEWDEGAAICKQMLESFALVDELTTRLANIAAFFGFDGWLINIENKIDPDQIPLLQTFARQLTQKCHAQLQFGTVLWYDSVIDTGELKWQDELNSSNEMFFEVCDGIFLNYCITSEKLRNSREKALCSGRQHDVYVGIDCFGRGSPGGGGFNLRMVLEMVLAEGLSCAFFAPGWVLEHLGPENFQNNNTKFWGILSDLLNTRPTSPPFSTSFCQGKGEKYFLHGKVISDKPWYNLGLQQLQPSFTQSQFISYHITEKQISNLTEPHSNEGDKMKTADSLGIETVDGSRGKESGSSSSMETLSSMSCDDNSLEAADGAVAQDDASSITKTNYPETKDEKKIKVISEKKQADANPKMAWDLSCGYNGGGCICLEASSRFNQPVIFKLMDISGVKKLIQLCVTWKAQQNYHHQFALMLSPAPEEPSLDNAKIIFDTSTSLTAESLLSEKRSKSVSYLSPEQTLAASDHGSWIKSKYNILPENFKITDVEDMTLSAVLVPCDPLSSGSDVSTTAIDQPMCIWIGQIEALTELPLSSSTQPSFVSNLCCLEVKAGPKLCSTDLEQMVMNPCFKDKQTVCSSVSNSNYHSPECNSDNLEKISPNIPVALDTQKTMLSLTNTMESFVESTPVHFKKLDLTNQDIETYDSCIVRYLLRWDVVNNGNIYFFIVYLKTETGSKNFLGFTYSTHFIYCTNNEIKNMSFFIQPVILA